MEDNYNSLFINDRRFYELEIGDLVFISSYGFVLKKQVIEANSVDGIKVVRLVTFGEKPDHKNTFKLTNSEIGFVNRSDYIYFFNQKEAVEHAINYCKDFIQKEERLISVHSEKLNHLEKLKYKIEE